MEERPPNLHFGRWVGFRVEKEEKHEQKPKQEILQCVWGSVSHPYGLSKWRGQGWVRQEGSRESPSSPSQQTPSPAWCAFCTTGTGAGLGKYLRGTSDVTSRAVAVCSAASSRMPWALQLFLKVLSLSRTPKIPAVGHPVGEHLSMGVSDQPGWSSHLTDQQPRTIYEEGPYSSLVF